MKDYQSLSHTKMGLQVSRGVHPEVPTEGISGTLRQHFGRDIS